MCRLTPLGSGLHRGAGLDSTRAGATDLVEELRRCVGVGQEDGLHPGSSHSHMEDPTLRIEVVAQAVREKPLVHAEHDDAIPLPALDPVNGRQQNTGPRDRPWLQDSTKPRLERRRFGVETGHRLEGDQVVHVSGSIRLVTGSVEDIDRVAQAHFEPDRPQSGDRRGGAAPGNGVEVGRVQPQLLDVTARQPPGEPADIGDGGAS